MTKIQMEEVTGNLIVLGEKDGQVQSIGGVLKEIRPDRKYEGRSQYVLATPEGEKTVAGCATLTNKIDESFIGFLLTFRYDGTGTTETGQSFKRVKVEKSKQPYHGEAADGVRPYSCSQRRTIDRRIQS